jgi:hypothetical protein
MEPMSGAAAIQTIEARPSHTHRRDYDPSGDTTTIDRSLDARTVVSTPERSLDARTVASTPGTRSLHGRCG